MTYMQSGKGTSVQTTQSETESSKQISKTKKVKTNVKSNVDLLSEIDFSGGPAPLQPAIVSTKAETPLSRRVSLPSSDISEHEPKEIEHIPETPTDLPQISIDRKPSIDNLSLCSEVSSSAFDLDSASVVGETKKPQVNTFDDPKIMNSFVKEVERYEKTIEALNVTMLNGKTPLMNKWKELNDALAKSEPNRSTSIAKLFPEKNRSIDCIPYNNCLVRLERTTDDYINAAFIKNLTLGDIPSMFILGQTPLNNTVNDFWSMIWTQKCRTVVCLHTPNEILDMFWPTELNKERSFDDFSITLVKINDLSNCSEYNLKVTLAGADATLNISLLQLKSWNKTLPAQAVGVAKNIIHSYREKFEDNGTHFPIVLTCLTGSERSGIVAVAICSILATKLHRPMLIVWTTYKKTTYNKIESDVNVKCFSCVRANKLFNHRANAVYCTSRGEYLATRQNIQIKTICNRGTTFLCTL
ncbi:PTPN23.2 family protein [Megaselia abdita]